jgi:RNA polymerase sigma-70 factor, ECF subfamily
MTASVSARVTRGPSLEPFPLADDAALVAALKQGDGKAPRILFERYGAHVQRILARVLGMDSELPDLVHDVFVRALAGVERLEDPSALRAWLTSIAVFTAREHVRSRKRRSWLALFGFDEVPEAPWIPVTDAQEALAATYSILDRLPLDERTVFALRFLEEMEIAEVAAACGISISTAKRRIAQAEKRFLAAARRHPELRARIERGTRWSEP